MKYDELRSWRDALESEADALKQRRADLDVDIQKISKKLELVSQMLLIESGAPAQLNTQSAVLSDHKATPANVRESARLVLASSARPLHINEIHQAFIERGFAIPGAGTPFNILVHLVKSSGFVRVARGTYALAGAVPDALVLPTKPRQSRSKKGSRTRKTKGGKDGI